MTSPTRGRVKSFAQCEVIYHARDEGQGVPPHGPASREAGPPLGTASREEKKQEQVLNQKPAKTPEEPHIPMDMGIDQLDLESSIRKGGPVPTDN